MSIQILRKDLLHNDALSISILCQMDLDVYLLDVKWIYILQKAIPLTILLCVAI